MFNIVTNVEYIFLILFDFYLFLHVFFYLIRSYFLQFFLYLFQVATPPKSSKFLLLEQKVLKSSRNCYLGQKSPQITDSMSHFS